MFKWINTAAIFACLWSMLMFIACVNLISAGFETFISNMIFAVIVGGAITLFLYRIYIRIADMRLDHELKKIGIERERALIKSIKAVAALPHQYKPSVSGVTPTPGTPPHPPEEAKTPNKKIPVFKDGRVVMYAKSSKEALIANMYFETTPDGRRKHTITDIAIAAHGQKGGWQNGNVKEVINEIKDIYQGD